MNGCDETLIRDHEVISFTSAANETKPAGSSRQRLRSVAKYRLDPSSLMRRCAAGP